MSERKIKIGITQGDYNGIGNEVIVKALANKDILDLFTPVIFGSSELLKESAGMIGADDFRIKVVDNAANATDGAVNVVEVCPETPEVTPGTPSRKAGLAAVAALEAASEAIEGGDIDLLVTAPIDKNSVRGKDFEFPGHTEYLEEKFAVKDGSALMILADDRMRVSLVTTHLPLHEVASHITKENVERKIREFANALRMDFRCDRPRIAVLSLNPHCGDGGVLGSEEKDAIIPAVKACQADGILAFGPVAADGLFGSGAYQAYDGILAMYHDQGLAPFKALARSGGVNFTAGLDIIRTSPAHGTAYDKAGKGVADETSMREAIYMAIDIARARVDYLDASENPLEIREVKPREKKNKPKPQDAREHSETGHDEKSEASRPAEEAEKGGHPEEGAANS